ncbi:MAG: hypothetical protein WC162_11405 [Sphaerochaetaceae bacterium]
MKKKFIVFALVLVAFTSLIFADNLQKVYPVDSPIYSGIKVLYSEVGMAPPSTSGPWSAAEFIHMLQIIPQNSLNQKGKELYSKLLSAIDKPNMDKKVAQGSVKFYPNFEIYQHQNTTDYKYDSDWIYDYDSRKPLLDIPIELYLTDYIYSESNFAFLKTRITYNNQTSTTDSSEIYSPSFNTNYPFGEDLVDQVDLNFPERAVIGMGFMNSALTLGRDDLNFSSGKTGSLTVGDHLDYYDFVRFNTFTDDFKFTYLVAGFDSPSWIDHNQNNTVDDDDITITTDSDDDVSGVSDNDDDNLKMYIAHRFEFRWLNNHLNFALTEAIIYQSSTIDFRYLNPALFYHNLFIRGNANSTLSAEVEITPIRHITIYGNIVVDEFPYPGEDQTSSGAHPNGIGQQYGVEATYLVGPGSLTGWFEYVKTDPFLYLRDGVDYIVQRRMFNMENGLYLDKNFLGYEYGNDIINIATGL